MVRWWRGAARGGRGLAIALCPCRLGLRGRLRVGLVGAAAVARFGQVRGFG